MATKRSFIRIRGDEELRAALDESARLCDRDVTNHARYLLRVILGLTEQQQEPARSPATITDAPAEPREQSHPKRPDLRLV